MKSRQITAVLVSAAGTLLMAGGWTILSATPAAARCAFGQFYRPSMHVCVGRAAFLKAARHGFREGARRFEARRVAAPARAAPVPAVMVARASIAPPASTRSARLLLTQSPVAPPKSPFGIIPGLTLN